MHRSSIRLATIMNLAHGKVHDAVPKPGVGANMVDTIQRHDGALPETQHHDTDGEPCWCGPDRLCAWCFIVAPCFHGPERIEVIIHKEAS